jgi:hypothetical protein
MMGEGDMIALRGHHLLCLIGYRGMGYSPEFAENMTRVHRSLRQTPDTEIMLVEGPDDLCKKFPDNQTYHCEDVNIDQRDRAILVKLGLQVGQGIRWRELQQQISENVVTSDIAHLCHTCSWRAYGVCEEGLVRIQSGNGLSEIAE